MHSDPSDDLLWLQCETVGVLRGGVTYPSRGVGAKVQTDPVSNQMLTNTDVNSWSVFSFKG